MTLDELLRNNPFGILATMHDPPRKQKRQTGVMYNVHRGQENIVFGVSPAAADIQSRPTTSSAAFYGQCFNCYYRAHSQKHCPLRWCSQCNTFGHSKLLHDGDGDVDVDVNVEGEEDML